MGILRDLMRAAVSKPRLAIEILLVAGLLCGSWAYNRKVDQLEQAKAESGELEDDLQRKIRIRDGQVEILKRENGKVVYRKIYAPPEGSIIIKKKDQAILLKRYQELLAKVKNASSDKEREEAGREIDKVLKDLDKPEEIVIKDKGFTFKPGMGIEWGGRQHGVEARIDAKWAYWRRYSAISGASRLGLDVGISRHLDDILPLRPKNIELFGAYKYLKFNNGPEAVVGIRVNF